jgi:hypothetical protein
VRINGIEGDNVVAVSRHSYEVLNCKEENTMLVGRGGVVYIEIKTTENTIATFYLYECIAEELLAVLQAWKGEKHIHDRPI